MKFIDEQMAELEACECESCGFHMGVDATYLEQVIGENGKVNYPVINDGA